MYSTALWHPQTLLLSGHLTTIIDNILLFWRIEILFLASFYQLGKSILISIWFLEWAFRTFMMTMLFKRIQGNVMIARAANLWNYTKPLLQHFHCPYCLPDLKCFRNLSCPHDICCNATTTKHKKCPCFTDGRNTGKWMACAGQAGQQAPPTCNWPFFIFWFLQVFLQNLNEEKRKKSWFTGRESNLSS